VADMGGVVAALNAITPAMIGKAVIAGLALAAFIMIAVVAFALAVRAAAAILENVSWDSIGKVFVATATGVIAAIGIAFAASLMQPPVVALGLTGLIGLAAFVLVGMVAFAVAVFVAAMILENVSWDSIGKVFLAVTLGVIVAIGLALAASLIQPPVVALGLTGMVGLAAFVLVGMVAFAVAVYVAAMILENVSWDSIGKMFLGVLGGMLAVVAVIFVSMLMNPLFAVTAGVSMLAGAAFMILGVLPFVAAALLVEALLSGITWDSINAMFAGVATGVEAVVAMIESANKIGIIKSTLGTARLLAGAAFMATAVVVFAKAAADSTAAIGTIALDDIKTMFSGLKDVVVSVVTLVWAAAFIDKDLTLGAEEGMKAIASFMTTGTLPFVNSIPEIAKKLEEVDVVSTAKLFESLMSIFKAGGILILAGALLASMGLLMVIAAAGLVAFTLFFTKSVAGLVDVIKVVQEIKLADPADMKQRIGIVVSIIQAMAQFASIGVNVAKLGITSKLLGGPDLTNVVASMDTFMKSTVENMISVIKQISKISTTLATDKLKQIEAVVSIVSAVTSLASSLSGPVKDLMAVTNSAWVGDNTSSKILLLSEELQKIIGAITKGVSGIIKEIGPIITAIAGATSNLSPEQLKGVEIGARILEAVSAIVGSVATALSGVKITGTPEQIKESGAALGSILPSIMEALGKLSDKLPTLISSVITATKGINLKDVDALTKRIDVLTKVLDFSSKFFDAVMLIPTKNIGIFDKRKKNFQSLIESITAMLTDPKGMQMLIPAISGFTEAAPEKLDSISKTFDFIHKFYDGVMLLPGGETAVFSKRLPNLTTLVAAIATFIGGEGLKKLPPLINGLTEVTPAKFDSINKTFDFVKEFSDVVGGIVSTDTTAFESVVASLATTLSKGGSMRKAIGAINEIGSIKKGQEDLLMNSFGAVERVISGYSGIVTSLEGAYIGVVADSVVAMVQDINDLNTMLSELNIDDIGITIDSLAQKLNISRDDIQIEHKPINIHMTMNISFDAPEFTKDILKSAATLIKTSQVPSLDQIGKSKFAKGTANEDYGS